MSKARRRNWGDRSAHIAPDETLDPDRFEAHIEGRQSVLESAPGSFADVSEAVEWARERAPAVYVRLPGEHFVRFAGEHAPAGDPEMPRWPPEPGESVPTAPIPPALLVELHPDKFVTEADDPSEHACQLKLVDRVRRALVEAGFAVRVLPRTEPDEATIRRRWRRAGSPEYYTWTTTTSLTHELVIRSDVDDIRDLESRALRAADSAMLEVLGRKPWRTHDESKKRCWGVTVKPHWHTFKA
jgi:hypothetical protein